MARKSNRFPAHGPDLRALLAACHAEPDDDTPRLVLADWLQEHDDPRGELMRLQCQLAALPAGAPEYDDLFARHQKWWKKYGKLWEKACSELMTDAGPHNRGLPTIGDTDELDDQLDLGRLSDPRPDRVAALVAVGWPGMTWVFVEDLFDEYGELPADVYEEIACEPFDRAPWVGSPTPVGVCFPDSLVVTPGIIDRLAKVPNLRGLSFAETQTSPNLLPRIARIKALEHLNLDDMRLNDDGVKALAPLKKLRTLSALSATITNAGAAALAKFTDLRELHLGTRRLTGDGYRALAKLSKLEVLELVKADDAAVRHLAPLTRLRRLELRGTAVTGRGVENFPLLTNLNLYATRADDAGLANVAALGRLRELNVSGTRITGATLARLPALRWLEVLDASDTAVGNKDLVHIERLKHLEHIDVSDSRVTKAGAVALEEKRKRATVFF